MPASNPLFSVIIPTYNRAALLNRAIQSVLDQTFDGWELIVVDDGSTDNTHKTVTSIKDFRIHYVFQEHSERSRARNRGLRETTGQYICFLDDDDFFLEKHFDYLSERIKEEGFPVAIFRTGMLIEKDGLRSPAPNFPASLEDDNPVLFFLQNMAGIHTLCFHKNILDRFSFDPRWHHFQDTHLLVRALLQYPFFQIPAYTSIYVRYPEMGSLQIFRGSEAEARTENNVAAIRDLFVQGGEPLQKKVFPGMEDFLIRQKYLDHAHGALTVGRPELAWKYFQKAQRATKGKIQWARSLRFWLRWMKIRLLGT